MVIGSEPAAAHARQLKEEQPQLLAAKCIVRPRCFMTIRHSKNKHDSHMLPRRSISRHRVFVPTIRILEKG
jgi:hypothetical protein